MRSDAINRYQRCQDTKIYERDSYPTLTSSMIPWERVSINRPVELLQENMQSCTVTNSNMREPLK